MKLIRPIFFIGGVPQNGEILAESIIKNILAIPELEKTNKEFEKMLEDNNVPSRFIHFCADNEDNLLKDFGLMSERIADELVKKGWEKYE